MDNTMTKEQIKTALAHKYRVAYSVYEQLALTGKELIQEGDFKANEIISRRALLRSQYLFGIKAAAKTLGIEEEEFMEAVNQDRATQSEKDTKGGDK